MLKAGKDHHLYDVDEDTNEVVGPICEQVSVIKKIDNLFTRVPSTVLVVNVWAKGRSTPTEVQLDSGLLHGKKCMPVLTRADFHIFPENEDLFMRYLINSAYKAPVIYTHDRLGFYETDDGKLVFLTDQVIGDFAEKSSYFEPKITAPCGTTDSWKAIVNQEVIGHPNMELALAIAASAPVAHLLQRAKIIVEVPVWGLIGESSTGKTTCVRGMVSIYGAPEEGSGLIKDFQATDTAIFAMLQDSGIIHIIDESTIAGKKDHSNMIYSLSKGMDKLRCNPDGSLKERQSFTGTVVITGEFSPLAQSTANLGIYARFVELSLPWTDDADHARRISQGFRKNYGTAIVPYAEYLLRFQNRPDLLEQGYNQELERFRAKIGNVSGVEERRLNMYATVTLSARLFNKALGLKLKVSGIRDLLVEIHHKATKKENLAQELYDTVMDEAVLHGAYFPKTEGKNKNEIIPTTLWGEYAKRRKRDVLWISGDKFREFTEKRFVNPAPYLSELHKQGLLEKFSDGYTTKHRLGHGQVRCYCFYMS